MKKSLVPVIPLLICMLILLSGGQLCARAGTISGNRYSILFLATSYLFLIGRTVLWIYILKRSPLTLAYPVLSLGYILIPLLSHMLFREELNPRIALGSIIIICGVLLITLSPGKPLKKRNPA